MDIDPLSERTRRARKAALLCAALIMVIKYFGVDVENIQIAAARFSMTEESLFYCLYLTWTYFFISFCVYLWADNRFLNANDPLARGLATIEEEYRNLEIHKTREELDRRLGSLQINRNIKDNLINSGIDKILNNLSSNIKLRPVELQLESEIKESFIGDQVELSEERLRSMKGILESELLLLQKSLVELQDGRSPVKQSILDAQEARNHSLWYWDFGVIILISAIAILMPSVA